MIMVAGATMPESRTAERARRAAGRLVCAGLVAVGLSACNPPASTTTTAPAPQPTRIDARRAEAFLDTLQQRTFQWFWETTDPRTGLTPDRWPARTFSSVAAIGFALTAYPIGAERRYVPRE